MDAKILVALFIVVNCYSSCGAALRRTPKVYNALITTDENLTSSRAFPVIQPTIHETGIASYPYGPYNPYGLYSNSLLRFPPPLVPGLSPRSQLPYPFQQPGPRYQPQHPQFPQQYPSTDDQEIPPTGPSVSNSDLPSLPPSGSAPSGPELEPQSQNEVLPPPSAPALESAPIPISEPKPSQVQPSEKLPISLNEFGLPPSLVPLQPYPPRNRQPLPLNFSPYPYQNFPVLYEPYNRFQDHFLPPYDYFPGNSFGFAAPPKTTAAPVTPSPSKAPIIPPQPKPQPEPQPQPQPQATTAAPQPPPEPPVPSQVPLDSIRNGSPNKNAEVPDVPPPPIPSGANSTKA